MNLGVAIRRARKACGLTQAALAELAGVSRQSIILLEKNGGRASTLYAVQRHISLNVARLAEGDVLHVQLRKARERQKLSQTAVANLAAVSVASVRASERGGGSLRTLSRVIGALAPSARLNARPPSYFRSRGDTRFTPVHIIKAVTDCFGPIDIDPCGHPDSFVGAGRIITETMNGLTTPWSGDVAFVNPPYSMLTAWIRRCGDAADRGEVKTVISLMPVRTETAAFRDRIFGKADVLLLKGRPSFHKANGEIMGSSPFALMFCIWGGKRDDVAAFARQTGCSIIWAEQSGSVMFKAA